jgi:integrase
MSAVPTGPGRCSTNFPLELRRLTPEHWPTADRTAWERATAEAAGPFERPGAAAHLAPATRRARAGSWGNFLAFLASRNDLDPAEAPADRLTPPRLTAWLKALRQRATASTVNQLVRDLSLAIAAMAPERDWSWVRQHPDRPRDAEIRASRKSVAPINLPLLVDRALALCDAADAAPASPEASLDHRDGLLLAMAAYLGLRRVNIVGLHLGTTVQQVGDGYRLTLTGKAVKNGVPVDVPAPPTLVPYLSRHLKVHRPRLLGGASDDGWLFLGRAGRPLGYGWLYSLFQRRGAELIGQPINPHAIRHAIATSLLLDNPRAIAVAGATLAHRGSRSVNEVYDRSGRAGAAAEWRRLIRYAAAGTNRRLSPTRR